MNGYSMAPPSLKEAILELRALALCRLAGKKGLKAEPSTVAHLVTYLSDREAMTEIKRLHERPNWFFGWLGRHPRRNN